MLDSHLPHEIMDRGTFLVCCNSAAPPPPPPPPPDAARSEPQVVGHTQGFQELIPAPERLPTVPKQTLLRRKAFEKSSSSSNGFGGVGIWGGGGGGGGFPKLEAPCWGPLFGGIY